jgi:hypothetical protein
VTRSEHSTQKSSARAGLFAKLGVMRSESSRVAPVGATRREHADRIDPLSSSHRISCLVLALAIAGLLAMTSVASAATTFAGAGEGSGEVDNPVGVAVNQLFGTVNLADESNHRIDEFDSSGRFLLAFGFGVLNGAEELQTCTVACRAGVQGPDAGQIRPKSVAVDNSAGASSGDIYVSDVFQHRVEKFSPSGELLLIFGGGVNETTGEDVCAKAQIESGDTCGAGTPGSGPGELSNPFGNPVSVDSLGDVWVGDIGRLEEFSSTGAFISEAELAGAGEVQSLAVDASGDLFVKSALVAGVRKVAPDGAAVAAYPVLDEAGQPSTVTLDGSGDLFVGDSTSPYRFLEYEAASGVQTEVFGAGEVTGGPGGGAIAFGDTAKVLYGADSRCCEESAAQAFTLPPAGPIVQAGGTHTSEVHKIAATLEATIIPEGKATTFHAQYISEAQFKQDGETFGAGTLTTPESASIGEDFSEDRVSTTVTGLEVETAYRFRVIATNSNGTATGETDAFTTLPPLRIESSYALDVTATSAALGAQIDPLGETATYRFEYISEAAYREDGESFSGPQPANSIPQPDGGIGAEEEGVEVIQRLQGLVPNTGYRYRVLALDSVVPDGIAGPTHAFTTQGAGGSLVLPDGRDWELVSPPDKHGAGILPIFGLAPGTEAAASGGAMAYLTTAPTEAEPAGNSNFTQVLSARGPDGWSSRDIAIPHNQSTGATTSVDEYRTFSSDLSLGLVQPFGAFNPSLSEEASEQGPYLRSDYVHGDSGAFCTSACYRPLVTGAPGFENVRPGAEFGGNVIKGVKCPPEPLCGPQLLAGTPDLRHVVLYSLAGLTSTPGDEGGLYEWSGGRLQLVSILPGGNPAGRGSSAGQGSSEVGSVITPTVVRNAVSADGSRVYFTNGGVLYAREDIGTPQARTVAVPGGAFQTASAEGSRVFVLASGQLAEFSLESEASVPLATGVLGVIGASEDGSSVYFVSDSALTGEQANARGQKAETGQPNLYLSRDGSTVFVATLSAEDSPDWGGGQSDLTLMTARVSPDGSWLAFMSQRSLTGYDNRDAVSGMPDQEVFVYRAPGGGDGVLACASCDQTGARPYGVEYTRLEISNGAGLVGGGSGVWPKAQWLAANIPAWTSPYHQSRYLSDSGRLFFNSSDGLVPQDTNGAEDVYQYEPPGAGDCSAESAVFGRASNGCVSLISSGTSPEESAFLDASESGADVFFLTAAKLSSQDPDSSLDVYDAHQCSTSAPCFPPPPPPPPACEGDACQSPVAAPSDPTPGSLTFHGPGNSSTAVPVRASAKAKPLSRSRRLANALKACTRKPKKERTACRTRARRRYGSVKSPANIKRRTK